MLGEGSANSFNRRQTGDPKTFPWKTAHEGPEELTVLFWWFLNICTV